MSEHFIQANALNIPLADRSVQMCVTSPPYYGLRDYGTATWIGGDEECDHVKTKRTNLDSGLRNDGRKHKGLYEGEKATELEIAYRDICAKCGAARVDNQLGLEPTPEEYVANMVQVFREVKRVLRDDGVLWIVIGDSYASDIKNGGRNDTEKMYGENSQHLSKHINIKVNHGLKPKDLVGIPWRVAFALQADGWWLRSDVIWSKPNPMPESVTDRPTKAHEYVFMLTKSQRYYYDYQAILETASYDGRKDEQFKGAIKSYNGVMPGGKPQSFAQNGHPRWNKDNNGNRVRNKRTVWHVATAPYKGAHYATYPPKLIEPCILAGSRQGDIVLDPFNGSGTTGLVARKHGRNYIGTDLSLEYIHQAEERLSHTALKNWQRGKAVETTDLGPLFEVTA